MATLVKIFNAGNFGGFHAGLATAQPSLGAAVHGPFFSREIPRKVSGGAGTTAATGTAQSGDTFKTGSQPVAPSVPPRSVGPIGRSDTQSVSERQRVLAVELFTEVLKNLVPVYALGVEDEISSFIKISPEEWADQEESANGFAFAELFSTVCGYITEDENAWKTLVNDILAISKASSDGVRGHRSDPKTAAQKKLAEFVVAQAEVQVLARYPGIEAAYNEEFAKTLPVGIYTRHVYASILALILNPKFAEDPQAYLGLLRTLRGDDKNYRFPIDAVLSFISQHFSSATTSQGAEVATPATEAAETSAKHPVGHRISFGDYLKLLQKEETLTQAIDWYVTRYLPGEQGGQVSLSEDDKVKLIEGIKTFFGNIIDPEENIEDPQAYLADCRKGAEVLLKSKHTPEADRREHQIAIYAIDFFKAAYDHQSPRGGIKA